MSYFENECEPCLRTKTKQYTKIHINTLHVTCVYNENNFNIKFNSILLGFKIK